MKSLNTIFLTAAIGLAGMSALNFPIIFFDSLSAKFFGLVSFFGVNYLIALIFTIYFKHSLAKVFTVSLLLTLLGIAFHAAVEWGEDSFMQFFTVPSLFFYVLSQSCYITSIALASKTKVFFRNGKIELKQDS